MEEGDMGPSKSSILAHITVSLVEPIFLFTRMGSTAFLAQLVLT